jgi:multisubunit Na+/H+ antiporter MnhB subunit
LSSQPGLGLIQVVVAGFALVCQRLIIHNETVRVVGVIHPRIATLAAPVVLFAVGIRVIVWLAAALLAEMREHVLQRHALTLLRGHGGVSLSLLA